MHATRLWAALAFVLGGTFATICPANAQDTTLIAHPRIFSYHGKQNTGKKNEALTIGGWIGYQTPRFRNTLALGATVYGSAPVHAPANGDGTFLLEPGQDAYVVLGEAFVTLSVRDLVQLKGGRQLVDQGYINPSDIRMTPYTFEGVTLRAHTDSVRYLAGYLWKIKQWNTNDFVSMSQKAGATDRSAGVAFAGVEYTPTTDVQLEVSEQYGFDTFNTLYAKGSYRRALNDDWSIGIGAEFTDQRAVGDALVHTSASSDWRTHVVSSRLQLLWRALTVRAALSKTGAGSAIQNPWGTYPGYLSMIDAPASQGFARANEKGWLLGASYEPSPAFLIVINVGSGSDAIDPTTSARLPNQKEYNIRIEARRSTGLGNVKLTVRGAIYDRADVGRRGGQIHFILDWDLADAW